MVVHTSCMYSDDIDVEYYEEGERIRIDPNAISANYHSILKRGAVLLDFLAQKLGAKNFTLEQKRQALLFRPEIYNCFGATDFCE